MDNIQIPITENGTTTLLTAGKYCDRNIEVKVDVPSAEQPIDWLAEFMDKYQANLEKETSWNYAFAGRGWTDETYNPPRPIVVTGACAQMFNQSQITSTKVPITIDSADTSNQSIFAYCADLITIPSLKVTEKVPAFTAWFHNCRVLETLNFTEDSVIAADIPLDRCNVLSNASVQTVINALKDLTGQTAKKITLHADVGAKLTDEQKATITAKNWTLVY